MSPLIRKDRIWPAIIVTVLATYVVLALVAARVASHDPSFAIEPDYYRKAVTWDSSLAQDRRNAALGWRIIPSLGPVGSGVATSFVLGIRDAAGAPVSGAAVSIEARQVAHAGDVVRAALVTGTDGAYAAQLPLARAGLWEVRIVAARGAERFVTSVRMEASPAAMARTVTERPGDPSADRLRAGTRREAAPATPRPQGQ